MRCLLFVPVLLLLLCFVGCQSPQSQSPAITPTKDVRVSFPKEGDVQIHGDLIIHYHQTTIVELGGGNKSDQTTTQDISPKLEGLP